MKIKQKRAFTNQSWEQVAVPPGDGRCRALGMFRQMLEGTRPSGRSGAQGAGAGGVVSRWKAQLTPRVCKSTFWTEKNEL